MCSPMSPPPPPPPPGWRRKKSPDRTDALLQAAQEAREKAQGKTHPLWWRIVWKFWVFLRRFF